MFQKKSFLSVILTLALSLTLAACSSSLAGITLFSQAQSADPAKMAVVNKLGIGILKMEGTSQAVTASQASTLLPLWKAVYTMGNDKSASAAEVSALYDQIEESLTAGQINSIQKLTWTQQDLSNLMQKYNVTSLNQAASASTSSTVSNVSNNTQNAGGSIDLGGGPMNDIASVGINTTGSSVSSTTTHSSSSTTKTSQASGTSNLNPVFANAIVTLLKQRITLE